MSINKSFDRETSEIIESSNKNLSTFVLDDSKKQIMNNTEKMESRESAVIDELTWSYTVNGNSVTITGVDPAEGTIEIPSEIDGKPVTGIADYAFFWKSFTSVTIPGSVKNIGFRTFYRCSITNLVICDGVTHIGNQAFWYCKNLSSVTIPDSVTDIGWGAFASCSDLTSVTIGTGIKSIGDDAFDSCPNLQTIYYPPCYFVQNGNETGTVLYNIRENTNVKTRNGIIEVTAAGITKQFSITQDGCDPILEISESDQTISPVTVSGTFNVTANMSWIVTIEGEVDWLTVSSSTGDGNGTVTYNVTENVGTESRSGIINISPDPELGLRTISRSFTVTQEAPRITIDQSSLTISPIAATGQAFNIVYANIPWTIAEDVDWLTVTTEAETNNIIYNVAENTGTARTAEVSIIGTNTPATTEVFVLTQKEPNIELLQSSQEITYEKITESFTVTSNIPCTVSKEEGIDWLTINTPDITAGNESISYTAEKNYAVITRTGTITIAGYGKSETFTVIQSAAPSIIELPVSSQTVSPFSAEGNTFEVIANVPWEVSSNDDWLTVTTLNGNGNGNGIAEIVSYNVAENTGSEREGTITVTDGNEISIDFTVIQEAPRITIDPEAKTFLPSGSNAETLSVSSNVNWTAESNSDWISVLSPEGSLSGIVEYKIDENQSNQERTGNITVSGFGTSTVFSITQEKSFIELPVFSQTFSYNAFTNQIFEVIANAPWRVSSDDNWLRITTLTGNGNGTVKYNVNENTRANERSGEIKVRSWEALSTFTVIQEAAPPILDLSETNKTVSPDIATGLTFKVTANMSWTAESNAEWLTLSPASGDNNKTITYNVTENTGSKREGIITVVGGDLSKTFTVTQEKPVIVLENHIRQFTSEGAENAILTVTANMSWTAESNVDWITINEPRDLAERKNLLYSVEPYTENNATRSGKIFISGCETTKEFNVIQVGATPVLRLEENDRTFTSRGASEQTLKVNSNMPWTAESNAEWLNITLNSGRGNGTVVYDISLYTDKTIPRIGIITVSAYGGLTETLTITQERAPEIILGENETIDSDKAVDLSLTITANVSWTAKSTTSWLTVKTESGVENGNILYDVTENTGSTTRIGKIIVSGGGLTKTFILTQKTIWLYSADENSKTAILNGTTKDKEILLIPAVIDGYRITAIKNSAFENSNTLTNVVIPTSITDIGNSAFAGCSNLTTITIPQYISNEVKNNVFSDCGYEPTVYFYQKYKDNDELETEDEAKLRVFETLFEESGYTINEINWVCLESVFEVDPNPANFKRESGDFSFIDTVADLAVNRDFVNGYLEMKSGSSNEKTVVWETLSAIGNDISEVLYENVLNYIQNVADINTCAVKSVCSMSKMVGAENYMIIDELEKLPKGILQLLDIFSIKREYLIDRNILSSLTRLGFLETVKSEISTGNNTEVFRKINELSELSSDISAATLDETITNVISKEKWEATISSVFAAELSSKIYIKYMSDPDDFVYNNLSSTITKLKWYEFSPDFLDNPYRKEVQDLKITLAVPGTFNPFTAADDVYFSGKDFDSSNGAEKSLVDKVLECRARQKFIRKDENNGTYITNKPETRYAWYKEREFYDYLVFIHDQYASKQNQGYLSKYSLDATYSELSGINADLEDIVDLPEDSTIQQTARLFTRIALAIADMREQIKIQAQKNHMRGTFVLISYLINQYLTKNIPIRYPELSGLPEKIGPFKQDEADKSSDVKIQLQEYEDNTEYYNLATKTSQNANNRGTNARFWELENDSEEIPFSEIDEFYLDTLNLKHSLSADSNTKEKNPRDFLDIIYNIGADMGHLDADSNQVVIPSLLADNDSAMEVDNHPELSADYYIINALQRNLYLSYTGNAIGFAPEKNFKNKTHSSYQIHPYLWKFTEYDGLKSSIENAYYNSANEDMIKVLVAGPISAHIGNYGNNVNIWKDNFFDFTGYKSRYENGWHSEKNGLLEHYDGAWYPDAIEEYMDCFKGNSQKYNGIAGDNPFLGLLYSVYNRKTTDNILNDGISAYTLSMVLGAETIISTDEVLLSNLYKPMFAWKDDKDEKQAEYDICLSKYDVEDESSISAFEEASRNLAAVIAAKPETFYEKWYKTNISRNEAIYITNQLYVYANRISSIYNESISISNDYYDIYKYGLDKYGNSIILYKSYPLSSNYTEKKNTVGNLWIRKNAHPIAFPAFDSYDSSTYMSTSWPQVRNDAKNKLNNTLLNYLSANSYNNLVYDFNVTNSYKYMAIAVKTELSNNYGASEVYLLEPHENISEYDSENYEYGYSYTLRSYNEMDHSYDKINVNTSTSEGDSSFRFSGFFNNKTDILAVFSKTKYIERENTVGLFENIGNLAFYNCDNLNMKNIMGTATKNISNGAFENCSSLVSVFIPKNVENIGVNPFFDCSELTAIYVANNNEYYKDLSGVLYSKNNVLLVYPMNKDGSYEIDNNTLSIASKAFYNCKNLDAITFGTKITAVGNDAFLSCSNLQAINIYDFSKWCEIEFTNLYANPLWNTKNFYCNGIEKKLSGHLDIPNNTQKIGDNVFNYCIDLSSVFIPGNVQSIGGGSFANCYNLSSVIIGNGTKNIKIGAFYQCSSLTGVSLPNSVINMENSVFDGCTNLLSIKIPQYICSLGLGVHSVFRSSRNNIRNIEIINGVTKIAEDSFMYFSNVSSIILPNSLTSIEDDAFVQCTSLSTISIPNNVREVGVNLFRGCTSLTSISIPQCVCINRISSVLSDVTSKIREVTIDNGVTDIGDYAFQNCTNLSSVYIPNTVKNIGRYAFANRTRISSITIPDSVINIGNAAFNECTSLSSITIPDSVINIGNAAFCNCYNLSSITIPDSVTNIGSSIFSNCSRLETVKLPNNISCIYDDSFYSCRALLSITIPDSVIEIRSRAFETCSNLSTVVLGNNIKNIDYHVFANCIKLESINIPASVINIGMEAFDNCPSDLFDNTTIPGYSLLDGWIIKTSGTFSSNLDLNGVRGLASRIFLDHSEIESITFGNTLIGISDGAFENCTGLTEVTIPANIINIGNWVFYGCSNLENIIVVNENPNYSTENGVLFDKLKTELIQYPCKKVGPYIIPNTVTRIKEYAFATSKLTDITIPESVTNIEDYVFEACSELRIVRMGRCRPVIGSLYNGIFSGCDITEIHYLYAEGEEDDNTAVTNLKNIFGTNSGIYLNTVNFINDNS